MRSLPIRLICTAAAAAVFASTALAAKQAKNVILMIADGSGFNSFAATSMYEGKLGKQVYDGKGWVKVACSTYPLNLSSKPQQTGKQDENLVYAPPLAWALDPTYKWLKTTATDSAAAGTAIASGVKTYNNAINWSDYGQPLKNLHQYFQGAGKMTGAVTSVPWSHATPAAMVAHNPSRNDYAGIADEMVKSSMNVIMGAGHPWYDDDGKRLETPNKTKYTGNFVFLEPAEKYGDIRLIESLEDFNALANGKLDMKGARRLIATARVESTLQQGRSTRDWNKDGKIDESDTKVAPVGGDPFVPTVPTLETMTKGALNLLGKSKNGFFLMVEGGAVDWANHANQPARMIEEQMDFNRAVEAVVKWVEKNGGWDNNLVIVTADHETGCLWGPNSDKTPFDPLVDNGKGKMPGLRYNSGSHTNSLVPLFARGAGAQEFLAAAKFTDPKRGKYIDNTDIFKVILKAAGIAK